MNFKILVLNGADAAPLVQPHYERNEFPRVRIRKTDTFFVAVDDDSNTLGCVRFCVENKTALLRTMAVDSPIRSRGVGQALLKRFAEYLDENQIRDTHLLCSGRLNSFYSRIGFTKIEYSKTPLFLKERMLHYDPDLVKMTCMRRP